MPDFVLLTTRRTEFEAQMLASRLEADGIQCFLSGTAISSCVGPVTELNTSWSNPLGGVEVLVPSENLAEAREMIREYDTTNNETDVVRPASSAPKMAQLWAGTSVAALVFYAVLALWPNLPPLPVAGAAVTASVGFVFYINTRHL